jgi:hypothetical protein
VLQAKGFTVPPDISTTATKFSTFGPAGDGATDDSAKLQSALNAGDLYIDDPTRTYLINATVRVPNNRHVQCAKGAVLKTSLHNSSETGILTWQATSSGSVVGCTFYGTNTAPTFDNSATGNFPVDMYSVSDIVVVGNVFKNSWGDACVHMTYDASPSIGSRNNFVGFNDFEANGIYGVAVVAGADNYIGYNRAIDSAIGSESNSSTGYENTGNVFDNNYVQRINGSGYNGRDWLSGGSYPPGTDYSGNTVSNNVVTGTGITIDENGTSGAVAPAQYINNQCINGCTVH